MNKIVRNMFLGLAFSLFLVPICVAAMPTGDFYVDATNGSDENDGLTPETAFATLGTALYMADDVTIVVNDGRYRSDGCSARGVRLISVNGPSVTSIEELSVWCRSEADELLEVGVPNGAYPYGRSVAELRAINDFKAEGFTIVDSLVDGGTFTNCVFKDSELRFGRAYDSHFTGSVESDLYSYLDGGVYQSLLVNCIISNVQSYCCASSSLLVNCLVIDNSVEKNEWSEYAIAESSTLNHCTIVGNTNRLMLRCECVNSVVYGNDGDYSRLEQYEREYGQPYGSTSGFAWKSIFVRCCTDIDHAYYPRDYFDAGSSNIIDPPMFVDGYRLSTNSPCVDAAVELELYGRLPYDEERFLGGSLFWFQLETDLDGRPRTYGKASDIGAYELQTTAATNIPRSYVVTFEPDEYLAYGCCALTNVMPRVLQIVPAGGSAYWPWFDVPNPLIEINYGMGCLWDLHSDVDYSDVRSNLIVRAQWNWDDYYYDHDDVPQVTICGVETNGAYLLYGKYSSRRPVVIECYSCQTNVNGGYEYDWQCKTPFDYVASSSYYLYYYGSSYYSAYYGYDVHFSTSEWLSYYDSYRCSTVHLPPALNGYGWYGDGDDFVVSNISAYKAEGCFYTSVEASTNGNWSIELPYQPKDIGVRILPFTMDAYCFRASDSSQYSEPYPEQFPLYAISNEEVVPAPYIPYTYAYQYFDPDGRLVDIMESDCRIVEIGGYYPIVTVDEYQRVGSSFGWNIVWMKAPDEVCEFYGNDGSHVRVVTQHSVDFDLDDKADCLDENLLSQSVRSFTDAVEPPIKERDGWKFLRWNCDFTCVTSNMTVIAEYLRLSNTVSFVIGPHGRSADSDLMRQLVDWGAFATVPSVTPDPGWRFLGWDGEVTLPITNAVTFSAQYEPIVYGITFEDTKGCVNSNTNAYTVKDAIVFSPLSDLPEWHFDGWSPASIPLDSTGDITVTALWRPIVDAHIFGTWSEPQAFEYDGSAQGVGYSARLDVMDWPLNVTTQGTVRAVNVGEYAATAMAETIGVPETDEVYYRCAAVTNECRWSIVPKPVTKLLITYVSTAMIANGRPQTPQIVVRDVERGVRLTESDYTLTYENNVEPGMGVARIAGKGNYGGETAIGFPIVAGVSPSAGLNDGDGVFEVDAGTDWIADNAETHDGYASMRSGAIGDNRMSALTAVVHGAGTVSFWWKVSSQHFDSVLELDRLEFYVDGVRQKWINGERDWAKLSFKINGAGPHEIRWVYVKDGSVSEGRDCGWVDEVAWNKEWLIGDWLNDVDRTFATSSVNWQPDASVCTDGVGSMRSGACRQGQRSVLSTAVENAGTLTFKWKSSCAAYGSYVTDELSLLVDGEPVKDSEGNEIFINGQTDWRDVSYRITGAGRHEVQWIFEKVSDASVGQNCGWVDVVNWDTEPGTLTDDDLVVVAFDGVYDGRGHGASVSVKGAKVATVKYGTSRESMDAADSPTFEECGEHEVWFSVNVPDFHEFVGKTVVRISPRSIAGGKVTLGAALAYTGAVQTQEVSSVVADGLAATFAVLDNGVRDAGTYRLKVVGTGNFCGELSVPYVVAKARASVDDVTVEGYSQEVDAVVFAYDGKPHQPTVVAGYDGEAAIRFSLTEEGPYSDELDVSNAVERLEVWYEIVSANYERMIGNTRMTIRPLSIANAEVVLGEQVSDAEGRVVQLVDHVIADGLPATFEVADNVADEEGDFMLTVRGVGNFTGETKCPYSVGGIVLPPLMTPGDGTVFTNSQVVYFSAQTPGSKWYYTLDGTMPTTNSASASRANLHGKTTIRAIAILEGKLRSAVVEAHYALGTCGNPTIRLDGLSGQVFHFPGQMVVIEKREDEGVVRYTLDGSEPTAESRAYERPFAISETTTVKAKVFSESWFDSETVTAEMRFEVLSVPAPVIRVAGEYRGTRTTVSMSCALDGAVIRYTLDGSEPTAESTVYEAPMEIGGEVGSVILVKARAFRELYADSPVAEASVTRLWGVGDTLGVPDMVFEDTDWTVDEQATFNGHASLRSGRIGDGETSALETVVRGGGAVAFSWRTSCEDSDGDFIWDRAEFWVDGDCVARLEGESGWCTVTHELPGGNSEHRLRWLYVKDPEPGTTDGEDCAWLAELTWEPKEVTADAIVVDDPNGKIVLPAGKDISEVEVRVMNHGHDIFPYLNLPAARDGVIDLSQATVKAEIVMEALDPKQGAEIKLDPANPTLTTANTRKGLTYTLYEGEALEGMKAGDSTLGDGKPWTPRIEVKGGASAFYTIGVEK